jgi:hypothetical protein
MVGSTFLPSVYGVAVSAGAASSAFNFFGVRRSSRSLSGFVAVAGFARRSVAARFSVVWSSRLPGVCRGCAVRCRSGRWLVSVPVLAGSVPSACRSAGGRLPVGASGSGSALAARVSASPRFSPAPALPPPSRSALLSSFFPGLPAVGFACSSGSPSVPGVALSFAGAGRFGRAASVRRVAAALGFPVFAAAGSGFVVLVVGGGARGFLVSRRWLRWVRPLPASIRPRFWGVPLAAAVGRLLSRPLLPAPGVS